MTPVEIMALIIALVSLVKLIVAGVNPRIWYDKVVKGTWSNPMMMTILGLILACVSWYYLRVELTIVQVFAAMLFLGFIMMATIAPFSKELVKVADIFFKKDLMRKAWLGIIIWLGLIIWVLYALFV